MIAKRTIDVYTKGATEKDVAASGIAKIRGGRPPSSAVFLCPLHEGFLDFVRGIERCAVFLVCGNANSHAVHPKVAFTGEFFQKTLRGGLHG